MTHEIERSTYADLYGPTTGDRVRLGDTELFAKVERDHRTHGDEAVFGGGKTLRDGLGMAPGITQEEGALDWVITNATIIDPVLGIVAGDIGIRDGCVVGVGKARFGSQLGSRRVARPHSMPRAVTASRAFSQVVCHPFGAGWSTEEQEENPNGLMRDRI
jgi:hypothetical protein